MDESKTSEGGEKVGNLAEPMEGVEGGSTNEDVMVEVLGSDVFVDGVRSHEDDDEIDAVVSEDDGPDENNKTTDNMDIDSKYDSSEPLGGGSKDTDLVKDLGSSDTRVDTGEKEIPDQEGGLVAEASIIVVEETQLIDDDEGLVEETRVVVDEKNLMNETNDEAENSLEDDDVSRQGKTEDFVQTVVDASSGGPIKSSRPTSASTIPVHEQDGSESAAASTILATVEQVSPLTTKLVPNQEGEEHYNVNVVNGVECHPSLVPETPSSLGEDNLNPTDDVSPISEEIAAVMQSGGRKAVVSVLEEPITEEPSLELLAPVSVESEFKKIKEDTEGSSGVAVSHEENQAKDKSRVEDVACSTKEADDGGGILAADSEQPTQIVVARKTEEVDVECISSTCVIDQDSKPEGHLDSKIDDSANDVEAASSTCQMTEANMEVVTGSSEKVEETQEAIEQQVELINVVESEEPRPSIDDNHQEMEGGTVTIIPDHRQVLETTLAEPVAVGLEDNNTNYQMVVKPTQSSQPTGEIELGVPLEENITNAESHLILFEHTICESTEMDVQVTEHGECVLTVNEVVLSSSSNNDIQVVVVDNNSEYMDGSLTVNLPIDMDREQPPATDTGEKQLAVEVDIADIDETRVDTIQTEEEFHGEENVTADYDEQNGVKTETTFASYNLPQEKEDDFAVSDLVWGKVRSHPWWPGQIFDPSAASEAALKYHKKEDSYLVAYFGDRTFAWMNDASGLKPLRNHFSQLEKQSSSEAFQNAVGCALDEISRRTQLSFTCSCISQDERINIQIVENDGIKEELCKREGLVDASTTNTFEPDKLFEYLKDLAQLPYGGANRYELAVAKAQLLSFYRLKGGFSELPEFQDGGELVEGDTGNLNFDELSADDDDEHSSGGGQEEEEENKPPQKGSLKRKHNLRDITYPIKKGRSMKELMSETPNTNDDDQRSTKVVMNVTTPAPPVPKPSFKIGECISRVASQLTGSASLLKQQHADHEDAPERNVNEKEPSFQDLLLRLQVAAQEPLKEHANDNGNSSFDVFRSFFSDFRNSAVLEQNPELAKMGGGGGGGSKRKRPSHLDDGSTEAFEFEDMNDSYWTDRVIENGVEEELLPSDGGGAVAITTAKRLENHIVPVELKPHKTGRRPYNKRQHLETGTSTNHGNNGGLGFGIAGKPDYIDPNAPAELVMIFSEFGFFPATEVSLNRMFKRFGPLRESQTELDRDTCRARVVFKKCSDAEVACSSAGRFNIFGPVHVIYQVNYIVSPEFKTIAMIEDGGGQHEEDYIE